MHWSMHPAQRDAPGYQPESTHPWDAVASSSPWAGAGRYPPLTKPTGGRNTSHWQSQLEVEIGFSDLRDIAFLPPVGLKLGKLNVFSFSFLCSHLNCGADEGLKLEKVSQARASL
jgi:hypothetical protein